MKRLVVNITHKVTNRESNSFVIYLKEISQIPKLTPEEETLYTNRAANGDEEAINELVRRNLRFVISAAKQFCNSPNLLEELVNEGNIGLIKAANKFKPSIGVKFLTYAVYWIKKTICDYLEKNGNLVRLPSNKILAVKKFNDRVQQLEQKLGRPADITEVIETFIDESTSEDPEQIEEDIRQLERLYNTEFDSLDRELGSSDEGSLSFGDMIPDTSFDAPDHSVMQSGISFEISKYLKILKPKHQRVLTAYYGLDGAEPLALKEIAVELGITREMVRQIRASSLEKLRVAMKGSYSIF